MTTKSSATKAASVSFEKIEEVAQDEATDATCKEIAGHTQTLFSLVYRDDTVRRGGGRRSMLGWDEDVASVKGDDDMTIIAAQPVAASVRQLSLPPDCQK